MIKNIILTMYLLTVSFSLFGDCIARVYSGSEKPVYIIRDCRSAIDVIDVDVIDSSFSPMPTEKDKALLFEPFNESARSYARHTESYWHYSGSCADLPLNKKVTLKLKEHCSDLGTSLYNLLGDITIKSVVNLE